MRVLRIHEREVVPIGTPDGVSEREALLLESLSPKLPPGLLSFERRTIRFGPYCGVVAAKGVVLELVPKISGADGATARGVLIGMLRTAGELAGAEAGTAPLDHQYHHLLDVFILDFCGALSRVLRDGAIFRYVTLRDDVPAVRGRIEIGTLVRSRATSPGRILCEFDEWTVDNEYNRCLKGVLTHLRRLAIGQRARAVVADILDGFEHVSDRPTAVRDLEALQFDRTLRDWEPLFQRAAWLLRGLFPDVAAGHSKGTGLVFHMERVFERCLGRRLRQLWDQPTVGRRVHIQGPARSLATWEGRSAFGLRPDITVMRDGAAEMILDAKWKELDQVGRTIGIASADVYQLAAYASRYECGRVALVYPASPDRPPGLQASFRLEVPGSSVLEVHTVDLASLTKRGSLTASLHPPALTCCPFPGPL